MRYLESWKERAEKIARMVAAAKEVSNCDLSPKRMLFPMIVEKLASHMTGDPYATEHVLQKIYDELERLESRRPVRKSDLYYDVLNALSKFVIREKRKPTYSELCCDVKRIRGISTNDEKLERNVRFIVDSTGLWVLMAKWKGS